jgi:hypothetical protein
LWYTEKETEGKSERTEENERQKRKKAETKEKITLVDARVC